MAVPKKRTSQAKTRTRKAAWFAKAWQRSAKTLTIFRLAQIQSQKINRFNSTNDLKKQQGFSPN